METYFSNIFDSFLRGFTWFVNSFDGLFSLDGPFAFISFLIVMFACFGSLTALLGLIGSGINSTSKSLRSRGGKKGK